MKRSGKSDSDSGAIRLLARMIVFVSMCTMRLLQAIVHHFDKQGGHYHYDCSKFDQFRSFLRFWSHLATEEIFNGKFHFLCNA